MTYFVMITLSIIMFLVCILVRQLSILQDKKNNQEIKDLKANNRELKETNSELRELRRQEINNNTHLVNKNKALYMLYVETKNVLRGKRLSDEKISKINELVEIYESTNSH